MTKQGISFFEKFNNEAKTFITPGTVSLFLIILILFAAFSFFPKGSEKTNSIEQSQEQLQENTKLENKENPRVRTHVVVSGDSLSSIAQTFYGDKEKWPILAAENNIGNPDIIHVGTPIRIPNLEEQTSSTSTQVQNDSELENSAQTQEAQQQTHLVVAGDTLWELSQKYYGTGYLWFKIRDANQNKVGLLPNGRPLITPDTVLVIPDR